MTNLKEIIKEIELISKDYKTLENNKIKEGYNQYINFIILEAPNPEQYNLCDYWARLIR